MAGILPAWLGKYQQPPNPRLQRTRVRPAGGRSPLSRQPLGSAKLLLVFSAIVAALPWGCASTHQNASLGISIVDAVGGYPIPGIEIVATAKATGQVSRGTTDSQGRVSFSGLPIGDYSLASPTLGTSEDVLIPDHVQYRGGIQEVRVRADLSTDKKGIYVRPGVAA